MSDYHREQSDKGGYDRRPSMPYERRSNEVYPGTNETMGGSGGGGDGVNRNGTGGSSQQGGGKMGSNLQYNKGGNNNDKILRDGPIVRDSDENGRGGGRGRTGGNFGRNNGPSKFSHSGPYFNGPNFHRGLPFTPNHHNMPPNMRGKFVGPYGPMHAPPGGGYNRQMSGRFPGTQGFTPHHQNPRPHHPMPIHSGNNSIVQNQNQSMNQNSIQDNKQFHPKSHQNQSNSSIQNQNQDQSQHPQHNHQPGPTQGQQQNQPYSVNNSQMSGGGVLVSGLQPSSQNSNNDVPNSLVNKNMGVVVGGSSSSQLQHQNSQPGSHSMSPAGVMSQPPHNNAFSPNVNMNKNQPLLYHSQQRVPESVSRQLSMGMGGRPLQRPSLLGNVPNPAMANLEHQRAMLNEQVAKTDAGAHLNGWGSEEYERRSELHRDEYTKALAKELKVTAEVGRASEKYYTAKCRTERCDIRLQALEKQLRELESSEEAQAEP
eukprot:CFRG3307T1